jgi:hypothetical protein
MVLAQAKDPAIPRQGLGPPPQEGVPTTPAVYGPTFRLDPGMAAAVPSEQPLLRSPFPAPKYRKALPFARRHPREAISAALILRRSIMRREHVA